MNSPEQLPSEGKGTPSWLQLGQDGETESMLLGNAAGLEALRWAIDQALQHGEGEIAVEVSDLTAVRCVDRMPPEEPLSSGAPWGVYGCLTVAVALTALAMLGLWHLVQHGFR